MLGKIVGWFFGLVLKIVGGMKKERRTRRMSNWGNLRWNAMRETIRGWFHILPGFIAWILIHFVRISREWMYGLFAIGAIIILGLDLLRVQAVILADNIKASTDRYYSWVMRIRRHVVFFFVAIIYHDKFWGREDEFPDWFAKIHQPVLDNWLRGEAERKKLSTSWMSCAGMLVAYVFFPEYIAVLAIWYQAIADTTAKWYGLKEPRFGVFKKPKMIENKSIQGALTAFLACYSLSWVVISIDYWFGLSLFSSVDMNFSELSWMILVGSFTAVVAELFGWKIDNLTIPIIASCFMWLCVV
jgi:dolichol kinase